MKQLIRLILAGVLLCPAIGFLASCSEEEDCSMNERGMANCRLYTIDADGSVANDTLDSLTVTAFGTDSVIINNQKEVRDLILPLRYGADSTILVFRYSRYTTDTVILYHTNTPYFLSMDCGYQMQQRLTDATYTAHRLDSIYINNNEVGIYGQENIQLFY